MSIKKYYNNSSYNSCKFKDHNKNVLYGIIKTYCKDKNIFDVGCGFFINKLSKIISFNFYTGIDCDINVINNNKIKKTTKYLVDMNKSWQTQIQKMNHYLDKKHDIILIINSIHFAYKCLPNLIFNINKVAKQNSYIIIKFLNKTLINKLDKKIIINNTNFVRLIKENQIKYYYSHCHKTPVLENIFSDNEIIFEFSKNSWTFYKQYNFLKNYNSTWENYLNCFSIIIFKR